MRFAAARGPNVIHRMARSALYSFTGIRFVETVEKLVPFLRGWHRFAYEQHFAHLAPWERLFHGVYPDFATAIDHVLPGRAIGYDNPAAALFLGREAAIVPSDYPVLFWLARLLGERAVVFDLGGYLAIGYNSYKRFKIYPAGLRWLVYDVPAVVEAGRRFQVADPDPHVSYTTSLEDAASSDVLLAAGSLQFCERSIAQMLAEVERPPRHLLINKLPVGPRSFVTLQNMGPAVAPYRVFRDIDFTASLEQLGYEQIDRWENAELGCYIPFHPECTLQAFSGYYFRRRPLEDP